MISSTSAACARARSPRRKNVARARWESSKSSRCGVSCGSGPSSMVSQTSSPEGAKRVTNGPKIGLFGRKLAYASALCATAHPPSAHNPATDECDHASGTVAGRAKPSVGSRKRLAVWMTLKTKIGLGNRPAAAACSGTITPSDSAARRQACRQRGSASSAHSARSADFPPFHDSRGCCPSPGCS